MIHIELTTGLLHCDACGAECPQDANERARNAFTLAHGQCQRAPRPLVSTPSAAGQYESPAAGPESR